MPRRKLDIVIMAVVEIVDIAIELFSTAVCDCWIRSVALCVVCLKCYSNCAPLNPPFSGNRYPRTFWSPVRLDPGIRRVSNDFETTTDIGATPLAKVIPLP